MELEKSFLENKDQAIETLRELIAIDSIQKDPVTAASGEVYPFGQGVQDAFAYMLAKGEEAGFQTADFDHYGGHISFGTGKEVVGILGHLDVVPVSDDWEEAEPFSGALKDGYVIGRGTTDDKGPVLAAFYAMKILKEAGYKPDREIRLILGLDEETDWKGMTYYLEHAGNPDFGFTPDAEFPIVQAEKGILHFQLAKKLTGRGQDGFVLRKFTGGSARNAVPDRCEGVLNNKDPKRYEELKEICRKTGEKYHTSISARRTGASMKVSVQGVPSHAAKPEGGLNAISIFFEILSQIKLADEKLEEFVWFYNECIGFDTDGHRIGCELRDEISGGLTFCSSMVHLSKEAISLTVDVRYPVTLSEQDVYQGIRPYLDQYGLGMVSLSHQAPIYQADDSPLMKTLLGIYQKQTGDTENQPIIMGGGTFARACPNIVAFGGLFPEDPDLMHQKNEKISLDRFFSLVKIYMETIQTLGSLEFKMEKTNE